MIEEANTPLDAVDRQLLRHLQMDAFQTHQQLAEQVGVSTATCQRRVQRLRATGVIEAQVAVLSPRQLKAAGVPLLQAVVEVTLDHQSAERLDAFEARAGGDLAVQQLYRVSGGPDFVLMVCVADMDGYQALARRLLSGDVNVRNVRSYFVTQRTKMGVSLPI
jgi:Lrp/AsnC family transcriptional regulator, leucine-responsive regulatory protein